MCEQSLLWPHFATSQLHTMDFLVKSLYLNLAHSLTTHPSYAAKWSNKEGDYAAGHSPDHNDAGISSIPPQVTQIRIRARQSSEPARSIYTVWRSLNRMSLSVNTILQGVTHYYTK